MKNRRPWFILWSVAAVIALTVSGAAQGQTFSPFQPLPGDAGIGPSVEVQEASDIAAGGGGYLLVWIDQRTVIDGIVAFGGGPYFTPLHGNMRDIYGMRLDAGGNPIDSDPIIISNAGYNQGRRPRVAWNGENWLVTWLGERDAYFYDDVMAARVSPDGEVLDNPAITVRAATDLTDPAVASDGTNWLVVWPEFIGVVRGIRGARIGPDGTVLDPAGVPLRVDTYNTYADMVDLAFAQDEYFLVWTEGSSGRVVKGQRFGVSLGPIDAAPFPVGPGNAQRPRLATDGTGFFVAWHDEWSSTYQRILGSRVSHAGVVLDPSGILIVGLQAYMAFQPVVAWDGANWFVAYNRAGTAGFDNDLYLKRVSSGGVVLDPAGIPVRTGSAYQFEPAIAAGSAGGARILWTEVSAPGAAADICRAGVGADGTPGAAGTVSNGMSRQIRVRFASHDGVHMAVYLSEVSGQSRVMAQRLNDHGVALDAEPILVASGPEGGFGGPAVAWDGSRYLVVWAGELGDTYGRRLEADGTPLDPAPLLVLPDNDMPDVAALGDRFLVVGSHPYSGDLRGLQGARVQGADGTVLDPSPFWIGVDYDLNPRVAALGDRWFVIWERQPSHDQSASSIQGLFVTSAALVTPSFRVDSGPHGDDPDLAVNGDKALVVYSDNGTSIDGQFVDSSGALVGPEFLVDNGANQQYFPAVAWDGTQYLVAWTDYRNVGYLQQLRGDIYASRVDAAGSVLDPGGIQLSSGPLGEELPDVGGLNGRLVVAYSVLAGAGTAPETYRIGTRSLGVTGTVACEYTCSPAAGALPFTTTMTASLNNAYQDASRRLAGRIDVALAGGGSISGWKNGYTTVAPLSSYVTSWNQAVPALGALVGDNVFTLAAEDVTPPPFNQPPYPPAGNTDTAACTVTGMAP